MFVQAHSPGSSWTDKKHRFDQTFKIEQLHQSGNNLIFDNLYLYYYIHVYYIAINHFK